MIVSVLYRVPTCPYSYYLLKHLLALSRIRGRGVSEAAICWPSRTLIINHSALPRIHTLTQRWLAIQLLQQMDRGHSKAKVWPLHQFGGDRRSFLQKMASPCNDINGCVLQMHEDIVRTKSYISADARGLQTFAA